MLLGADTGFFIKVIEERPQAVDWWEQLRRGEHKLVVSTLSANELLAYFIKRGIVEKGVNL